MSNWLNPALPFVLALLAIPLVYFVRRSNRSYPSQTRSTRTDNDISYLVEPHPQEWAYELIRNGETVDCDVSFPLRALEVHSGFVRIVHDTPTDVTTTTVADDELLYLRRRSTRGVDRSPRVLLHSSEVFIPMEHGTLGWHVNDADPDLRGGMYFGENTSGDQICIVAGKNVRLNKR